MIQSTTQQHRRRQKRLLKLAGLVFIKVSIIQAFVVPQHRTLLFVIHNFTSDIISPWHCRFGRCLPIVSSLDYNDDRDNDKNAFLLESIRSMRVRELKVELHAQNISTRDVFEKEELVKRLLESRLESKVDDGRQPTESQHDHDATTTTTTVKTSHSPPDTFPIVAPLTFYSMESLNSIKASNRSNVYLRPSPGKFVSIDLELLPTPVGGATDPSLSPKKRMSVLVDTACTGLVLRPSTVSTLGLATYKNPVTFSAAGTTSTTKLTQLDQMILSGTTGPVYKKVPAAVMEIGALPPALGGIIGLSFLSQFECVDFDFGNGNLLLDKWNRDPPGTGTMIAESSLQMTTLGVWTVDVTLDGRGPVKMIVDTGASSSLLNWKGVADMNLSLDHVLVSRITGGMGAMGADNVALSLTHRFVCKRRVNFKGMGRSVTFLPGLNLTQEEEDGRQAFNIDIGDLPVLQQLEKDGVGGILGSDLLMRSRVVRLNLKNGPLGCRIQLFQ